MPTPRGPGRGSGASGTAASWSAWSRRCACTCRAGGAAIDVRVIRSLADLIPLEAAWKALAANTGAGVFLTWEWCHAWARHHVPDGDLRVLVADGADGSVTGIAPFHLFRRPGGPVRVRELRFLGTGEACPAYLDLIVAAGDREAFTDAVYETVYGDLDDWDVLTLEDLAAESPLVDGWAARVEGAGKVLDLCAPSACPVIDLPDTVEAFHLGLSRNARYNLKRKARWLTEAGKVEFHHGGLGPDDPLGLVTLEALHQGRWQAKAGPGAFADAHFAAFHRDVAEAFARNGWLDIDFLLLDGEPIAGIYGFTHSGCYYYYLPGFDPDRAPRASPGMQLLVHRVEAAVAAGCRRVDLLRGLAGYKLTLANGLRRCVGLRCYRRGLGALLFKGAQGARDLAKIVLRG